MEIKINPAPYMLLVEDEQELRDLMQICLENIFSGDVVAVGSVREAKEKLTARPDARLVVTDHSMPEETGEDLEKFILQSGWKIPLIVCSERFPGSLRPNYQAPYAFVQKPSIFEHLSLLVAEILAGEGPPPATRQYFGVRIPTILRLGLYDYDYYVRLSANRYVRISKGTEPFEPSDAHRFLAKNVSTLYVPEASSGTILAQFQASLAHREEENLLDPVKSLDLAGDAAEMARSIFHSFGWTPQVEALVQRGSKLALKAMATNPSFLELLRRRRQETGAYIDDRTGTLICLSVGLAKLMQWESDFTATKLSFAAILHDITLSQEELEDMAVLTARAAAGDQDPSTKKYREHPERAAELSAQIKDMPPDVDKIIRQHHERPDGTGFPTRAIHTRIGPLSAIFLMGEDLLNFFEDRSADELGPAAEEFLRERAELYSQGLFKKILAQLAAHSI